MIPENAPSPAVREIGTAELARQLAGDQPPHLAEILGPESFAKGHLPGAVNLPLANLAESAARLLPDRTADIVVYCASSTCQNSDLAERKLRSMGYEHVRVFKGGKAAWQDAGHLLEGGGVLNG